MTERDFPKKNYKENKKNWQVQYGGKSHRKGDGKLAKWGWESNLNTQVSSGHREMEGMEEPGYIWHYGRVTEAKDARSVRFASHSQKIRSRKKKDGEEDV